MVFVIVTHGPGPGTSQAGAGRTATLDVATGQTAHHALPCQSQVQGVRAGGATRPVIVNGVGAAQVCAGTAKGDVPVQNFQVSRVVVGMRADGRIQWSVYREFFCSSRVVDHSVRGPETQFPLARIALKNVDLIAVVVCVATAVQNHATAFRVPCKTRPTADHRCGCSRVPPGVDGNVVGVRPGRADSIEIDPHPGIFRRRLHQGQNRAGCDATVNGGPAGSGVRAWRQISLRRGSAIGPNVGGFIVTPAAPWQQRDDSHAACDLNAEPDETSSVHVPPYSFLQPRWQPVGRRALTKRKARDTRLRVAASVASKLSL